MKPWSRLLALFLAGAAAAASLADETDAARRLSLYRRARDLHHRGSHLLARSLYRQAARVPPGTPELQRRAVERLNFHRMQSMLVPVMPDPRVARAAQAHADYLARHTGEGELTLSQAHEEVPEWAGFTGEGPGERIRAQGLEGGASEGISSVLDPEGAVDHLVNSVYHRSALFRQEARSFGFGVDGRAVINLAWERGQEEEGDVWYYPGPGQEGVPPEFPGGETPDPLPGAIYPVGSPLSVGTAGGMPALERASLKGPEGSLRLRILREGTAPRTDLMGDFLYLFPEEPLSPGARYRARLRVRGPDEVARDLDWTFTAGTETPGVERYEIRVTDLDFTPPEVTVGTRLHFRAALEASHPARARLRWSVDGRVLADGTDRTFAWTVPGPGLHQVRATAHYGDLTTASGYQVLQFRIGEGAGEPSSLDELRRSDPDAEIWAVRILSFGHQPERFRRGEEVEFRVRFEATHPEALRVRWFVDGRRVAEGTDRTLDWLAVGTGVHRIEVEGYYPEIEGAYARGRIDIHL